MIKIVLTRITTDEFVKTQNDCTTFIELWDHVDTEKKSEVEENGFLFLKILHHRK